MYYAITGKIQQMLKHKKRNYLFYLDAVGNRAFVYLPRNG
jgi:hypothetical protein